MDWTEITVLAIGIAGVSFTFRWFADHARTDYAEEAPTRMADALTPYPSPDASTVRAVRTRSDRSKRGAA